MKALRCLFCRNMTEIHIINSQKKINGKLVTLLNAPVYFCPNCKETFISKEVQEVYTHIRENDIKNEKMLFNFNELINILNKG